jgi:predicted lipoprotein with Yx(FWY)xxD motif
MKRKMMIALAALSAVLLLTAGLAEAGGGKGTVKLRNTKAGKILVNSRGFTLYTFTKDKPNMDNCDATCQLAWPPLIAKGKVVAGSGVKKSMLGTITLANGKKQVTYGKHPLYTYVADGGPGETSYIGVFASGGKWYAINASGKAIKHP